MIRLQSFQEDAQNLIEKLESLIVENMIDNGDIGEDCQRQYLLNQILQVRHAVNGVENSDLFSDDITVLVNQHQGSKLIVNVNNEKESILIQSEEEWESFVNQFPQFNQEEHDITNHITMSRNDFESCL